jgi:hypothetical protein
VVEWKRSESWRVGLLLYRPRILLCRLFSSPDGALHLPRWLSCGYVGGFWASLLCSPIFSEAAASPLRFVSSNTCYALLWWVAPVGRVEQRRNDHALSYSLCLEI